MSGGLLTCVRSSSMNCVVVIFYCRVVFWLHVAHWKYTMWAQVRNYEHPKYLISEFAWGQWEGWFQYSSLNKLQSSLCASKYPCTARQSLSLSVICHNNNAIDNSEKAKSHSCITVSFNNCCLHLYNFYKMGNFPINSVLHRLRQSMNNFIVCKCGNGLLAFLVAEILRHMRH